MRTLGAALDSVEPGTVTITCRFDEGLTAAAAYFTGGPWRVSSMSPAAMLRCR
jgi:hypothetical protein